MTLHDQKRWQRHLLQRLQRCSQGTVTYSSKFFILISAILAFSAILATPGSSKDHSRYPIVYEPARPATYESTQPHAYEPAHPRAYEPAPPRPVAYEPAYPTTYQPAQDSHQIGNYYADSHNYVRDYLYYLWYWFWCNIVLIVILIIIIWYLIHWYYRSRIDHEFDSVDPTVMAIPDPTTQGNVRMMLIGLRNRLPV